MKNRFLLRGLLLSILMVPVFSGSLTQAQDAPKQKHSPKLSYDGVWVKLSAASPGIRSAEREFEAAAKASDRAGRHWWPHVFADARAFTTNDAGTILFSKLGTRSLSGMDLSPFAMNHPSELVFQRATLAAELPLFEGGARIAEASFRKKAAEGREHEKNLIVLMEYAESAALYGTLLITDQQEAELLPIRSLVASTIGKYELGAKGNPVGYSGLLGLKNLSHRVAGEMEMIRARREGARAALSQKAELRGDWQAIPAPIVAFVADYLEHGRQGLDGSLRATHAESAQTSMAEGLDHLRAGERARFLPKIALFGEGNLNFGNGASSSAYAAGAYVQWDLFSAQNFGAIRQAEVTADAARARVDATRLRQSSAVANAERTSRALREQMRLADRSLVLLEEQATAARKLFLNGSINALQLTEVFSRYVDLISAKAQMKFEFLRINSEMIQLVPFEIPVTAAVEVQND